MALGSPLCDAADGVGLDGAGRSSAQPAAAAAISAITRAATAIHREEDVGRRASVECALGSGMTPILVTLSGNPAKA
ncbi:hypothetical protein MHPYR_100032 [uncultured Mycobacterium sp.]|uniref:Uncharacterized protein n=1 Tax=uncultured Mycobacterium sp. TaxID=171292 RepID=A0A1Y5NX44_9MYCO|nr:hypothetical protein MHPYR_100032 [uncultured Mycobacterium sp.]